MRIESLIESWNASANELSMLLRPPGLLPITHRKALQISKTGDLLGIDDDLLLVAAIEICDDILLTTIGRPLRPLNRLGNDAAFSSERVHDSPLPSIL